MVAPAEAVNPKATTSDAVSTPRRRITSEITPHPSAPNGIRTRATALKGPRPGPLVDGGRGPGYRYMTQRLVWPQEQSLCATVQALQFQNSHQIHLRWFTSRTKRATIQSMISVRVTLSNVSAPPAREQWAKRPRFGSSRS